MMARHIRIVLTIMAGVGSAGAAISYFIRPFATVHFGLAAAPAPVVGAALYSEYCASCHGVNLQGDPNWRSPKDDGTLPPPPHDETGHTWHHGDDLLFNYTKLGGQAALEAMGVSGFKSGMPGFADQLSDAQIRNILAFIKSTWPDRIIALQNERSKAEQGSDN